MYVGTYVHHAMQESILKGMVWQQSITYSIR